MLSRAGLLLVVFGAVGCVSLRDATLMSADVSVTTFNAPVKCGPVGFRRVPLQSRFGEYVRVTVAAPVVLQGSAFIHADGLALEPRSWSSRGDLTVIEARFENVDPDKRFALSNERPIDITITGLEAPAGGSCEGAVFTLEHGRLVPPVDERAWLAELERRGGPELAARREAERRLMEERRQAHYAAWEARRLQQVGAEELALMEQRRQAHYAEWARRQAGEDGCVGGTCGAVSASASGACVDGTCGGMAGSATGGLVGVVASPSCVTGACGATGCVDGTCGVAGNAPGGAGVSPGCANGTCGVVAGGASGGASVSTGCVDGSCGAVAGGASGGGNVSTGCVDGTCGAVAGSTVAVGAGGAGVSAGCADGSCGSVAGSGGVNVSTGCVGGTCGTAATTSCATGACPLPAHTGCTSGTCSTCHAGACAGGAVACGSIAGVSVHVEPRDTAWAPYPGAMGSGGNAAGGGVAGSVDEWTLPTITTVATSPVPVEAQAPMPAPVCASCTAEPEVELDVGLSFLLPALFQAATQVAGSPAARVHGAVPVTAPVR